MIHIHRRFTGDKLGRYLYSANGGAWFRSTDLYAASRELQRQGYSGSATSYAENGTVSFVGTIERWAKLRLVEKKKGGIYVVPFVEHYKNENA